MVRLRDLDDDFYEFDDTNYCVIGARTKKRYTMGDNVKVQVMRCDLIRKQIDFKMITGDGPVSMPMPEHPPKRKGFSGREKKKEKPKQKSKKWRK